MTEKIRSFIAIELPETIKASLKQIQNRLKSIDPTCAKWVDPEGIHLTLKFLGNIDINQIEAITQAIRTSVQNIAPFEIEMSELGAFPNTRRAQVLWIGLGGDVKTLQILQEKLETNTAPLGFSPEGRDFRPHLTLARLKETATPQTRQALGESLAGIRIESHPRFKVSSICLMRSQLTRAGAIYTRVCEVEIN